MSGMDPTALLDQEEPVDQEGNEESQAFGLALVYSEGEWKALPLEGTSSCTEEMLWDFCWHYVGLRIRPSLKEEVKQEAIEGEVK